MLLYFSIPIFLLAFFCCWIVFALTRNSGYAQWIVFNVIFSLQWLIMGCDFYIDNKFVRPEKKTLIICNHPSYFDAMPIFWWAAKYNRMQDLVFVGKNSVAHAPIIGPIMANSYLLINRNFDADKGNIMTYCENLNMSDKPYIFVIFPEGTTYDEPTISKSNEYADENQINRFSNVLCPRTRGTQLILETLKPDSILDMTIIYDDYAKCYGSLQGLPFASSKGLINGQYPQSTTINIVDVTLDFMGDNVDVPTEIMKRWRIKDSYIRQHLIRHAIDTSFSKAMRFFMILMVLTKFFEKYIF